MFVKEVYDEPGNMFSMQIASKYYVERYILNWNTKQMLFIHTSKNSKPGGFCYSKPPSLLVSKICFNVRFLGKCVCIRCSRACEHIHTDTHMMIYAYTHIETCRYAYTQNPQNLRGYYSIQHSTKANDLKINTLHSLFVRRGPREGRRPAIPQGRLVNTQMNKI